MNFSQLKVGTRLFSGFALLLVFLVASLLLGLNRMASMQGRIDQITYVNNAQVQQIMAMRASVFDRMIAVRNVVLLTQMNEMQPEVDRVKEGEKKFAVADEKLLHLFEHPSTTEQERSLLKKIHEQHAAMLAPLNRAIELGLQNKAVEATKVLIDEVRPAQRKILDDLFELATLEDKLSHEASTEARASYESAQRLMITLGQLLFEPVRQGLLVHPLPQRVEQAAFHHHRDQGEVGRGGQVDLVAFAAHDGVGGHPLAVEKQVGRVLQRHGEAINAVVELPALAQSDAGVLAQQGHLGQLHLVDASLELAG